MKKIIFCIPQIYLGGAEQQIKYLANELATQFEVLIICFDNLNIEGIDSNIKIIKINKFCFYDLNFYKSLLKFRKYIKGNCVISGNISFDIICGFLKYFTNFDWWIRESNSPKARKINFKIQVRNFLGKKAKGIISNSKSGYYFWKLINKNSYFIKNGYPKKLLEIGNSKKYNYAVIASRMQEHKRINLAIDFFEKMKKDGYVNKLFICGTGPLKEQMKAYARKSIFSDSIVFKGFINHSDVIEILRISKIFISMSLYEGSPNTAIEALANNCELYLSNTYSHRELIPKNIGNFVELNDLTYQKSAKFNKSELQKFLSKYKIEKTTKSYIKTLKI